MWIDMVQAQIQIYSLQLLTTWLDTLSLIKRLPAFEIMSQRSGDGLLTARSETLMLRRRHRID